MNNTETLLIINSILLGLIGILFFALSYFLKNLHKDFKNMVEKVNTVHGELYTHLNLFQNLTRLFKKQIKGLKKRIRQIEKIISKQ